VQFGERRCQSLTLFPESDEPNGDRRVHMPASGTQPSPDRSRRSIRRKAWSGHAPGVEQGGRGFSATEAWCAKRLCV
jgi:hypothetical protein